MDKYNKFLAYPDVYLITFTTEWSRKTMLFRTTNSIIKLGSMHPPNFLSQFAP